MTGIPFIAALFKNILDADSVIDGRFFVAPHWGSELNASNLGQLVETFVPKTPKPFPAALMMPPRASADFTAATLTSYQMTLLFLTRSFATADNRTKTPSAVTGQSLHTVQDDWHDMQRCAIEFLRVLGELMPRVGRYLRISDKSHQVIDYITTIGNDRLSGVALNFGVFLPDICGPGALENYSSSAWTSIPVPPADPHPTHRH